MMLLSPLSHFVHTIKLFFYLTGEFPCPSFCSNKYIFVLYDHDSNAILMHPLKTWQDAEIKQAWVTLHDKLALYEVELHVYIMDNETSSDLKVLS